MSGITQASVAGGVLLILAGLPGWWSVAELDHDHKTRRRTACGCAVAGLELGSSGALRDIAHALDQPPTAHLHRHAIALAEVG